MSALAALSLVRGTSSYETVQSDATSRVVSTLTASGSAAAGSRRGRATKTDVENAFRKQLEEDEAELQKKDLTHIEPSKEFANEPFDLAFEDLAFSIEKPATDQPEKRPSLLESLGAAAPKTETQVILEPTSGAFQNSELVAIMGPSGCGKSTLLDMIADVKTAPYTGTVYVNGRPRDKTFRLISSYVPQEDIGFEHCTVREIIQFHQRLKADIPLDAPPELIAASNDRLLADLGLEHIADSKFGGATVRGISGGQRRRVTLAKGLCAWPVVLFADEPTSGLSATDAELVARCLRQNVHKYKTLIMVVIHQPRPEVAALFDRLLLLTSRPGRCVYDGPMTGNMSDLVAYCGRVGRPAPIHKNPADFVLDMITPGARGADPEAFVTYYKEHRRAEVVASVAAAIKGPPRPSPVALVQATRDRFPYEYHPLKEDQNVVTGFGTQFEALLRRRVTLVSRDPEVGYGVILGQLLQGIIASLVVQGALEKRINKDTDFDVYQNQLTVVMNMVMNVCYVALAAIPTFFNEKIVCVAEQSEGLYTPLAYLLASTMAALPVAAIAVLAGTLVQYVIGGPNPVYFVWALFPVVYLNCILNYLAMDSLFQLFAVTQKSAAEAQNIAMFFFAFVMMFNGVAPTPSAFPVWIRWGIWISPTYWATANLVVMGFFDEGTDASETISTSVGFRDHITYGSISPPVTYFLFVADILILKAATVYAMTHLKQAK